MDEQELLDIKKDVEEKKQERAKLQGKSEEVERRLSEEFGYKTPKHAKRDVVKQEKELTKLQEQYETLTAAISETYEQLEA